ncbi:Spc98 family-domain-containing protein [Baffinella frigidus]|nr:Spc98 family-domain-containing protein [Cryptophyta sp. CCMP2293]
MFARTRLALAPPDESAARGGDGEEEGALDRLRMVYDMEWPLGTLLLTPAVMLKYNALFSFLLRLKRAQAELQQAWHETQSGRYGRAIASTLHKLTQSSRHMTGMWALRSEMALLVNNLLYYLQCDVIDAHFETLRTQVKDSQSFETVRSAHGRFLESITNESLMRNKLAFSTITAILRIILKFARRMAQWRQVDRGQVEAATSMKRFRVSDSAAAVQGAYLGFPITVGGEVNVITGYTAAREVTLYRALKSAGISGDVAGCAEDIVGERYVIQAPTVTPEELTDVRRRFQRNAQLLFTVLKASQTHTTPVLAQLLLRMDFNRFLEQSQR